ncbi:MAG: polyamine aminopropyltransferase [Myxococcota bacterium]
MTAGQPKFVSPVPEHLEDGSSAPECRGFVDNGWYVEETAAAIRQSFRIANVLHEEQSPYQRIAVYDTPFFGRLMTLDDIVMLTERDEFIYHEMLVHIPLCSLDNPKNVLIVGGGDAGCLREVLKHDTIERVVQVDIDRRVTEVAQEHFDWVAPALRDPRAEVLFEDGVDYLVRHPEEFDLVVIDSTDPRGFALNLFLSDFYRSVARALRPDGVMTAQTESPYWSTPMVGAIYGELREAFEYVEAYLAQVPTYASGTWTMALAGAKPLAAKDRQRCDRLATSCGYYNAAVHDASFALPNCVRRAVEGTNDFAEHDARLNCRT